MTRGKSIPGQRRQQVRDRFSGTCVRCLTSGTQWHHRRRRGVGGEHRHCSCNGVWLCPACHKWVHSNPDAARASGYIVSADVDLPSLIAVKRPDGWWYLHHEGDVDALWNSEVEPGPDPVITTSALSRVRALHAGAIGCDGPTVRSDAESP